MYLHERSLVEQLAGKPFAMIGVNSDSDREKILATVTEKQITWRSFWNGPLGTGGPISNKWNVNGWPTIYLIDAEGIIRFKNPGPGLQELDERIVDLLAEIGHHVQLSQVQESE